MKEPQKLVETEGLDLAMFGQRLKHARRAKGLTLADLGARVGRTPSVLSLIENGKREPRLVRVDRFEMEAAPEGCMVILHNTDAPGVIGNVGQALGESKVNIAQFALARDKERKEALAVINVDSKVDEELLEKLRKLPHVRRVHQVVL